MSHQPTIKHNPKFKSIKSNPIKEQFLNVCDEMIHPDSYKGFYDFLEKSWDQAYNAGYYTAVNHIQKRI